MTDDTRHDGAESASAEQLGVADVLATTFRTIGANPSSTLGLTAALVVPATLINLALQIVQFYLLGDVESDPGGSMVAALGMMAIGAVTLAVAILTMLGTVIAAGALTHVTIETLLGRRTTVGVAMRASLGRVLPLVGTALVTGVLQFVGMFLCFVPGVIAWVWLVLALPSCLAEKVGPIEALQRSVELTEGHRLTIFLIGLVLGGAFMTVSLCVLSPSLVELFQQVQESVETGVPFTGLQDPLSPMQLVSTLLSMALQTVGVAVFSVMPAVMYVRLRGLRESVDANAVAQVFA